MKPAASTLINISGYRIFSLQDVFTLLIKSSSFTFAYYVLFGLIFFLFETKYYSKITENSADKSFIIIK